MRAAIRCVYLAASIGIARFRIWRLAALIYIHRYTGDLRSSQQTADRHQLFLRHPHGQHLHAQHRRRGRRRAVLLQRHAARQPELRGRHACDGAELCGREDRAGGVQDTQPARGCVARCMRRCGSAGCSMAAASPENTMTVLVPCHVNGLWGAVGTNRLPGIRRSNLSVYPAGEMTTLLVGVAACTASVVDHSTGAQGADLAA